MRKTRLCRALMMMLPMLFTSCLAQFLLLYQIFVSASSIHSNITNPNSTSTTGVKQKEMMPLLQTVCVVLFTLDMMNQYCALARSSMVPFASHFKLENSETFYELRIPVLKRVFMYLIVGLTEFTVWFCLLLVGLFFLVTTTDSTSLILDTLALNFITQIDEYIFSATISERLRNIVSQHQVRFRKRCVSKKLEDAYFIHYHLPLVLLFSSLFVFLCSPCAQVYRLALYKVPKYQVNMAISLSAFAVYFSVLSISYCMCKCFCKNAKNKIKPSG